MGQKVNPHGARVGVIFDWSTRWYSNKKNFASQLKEDYELQGKICWHFYDDAGNKTESVILDANGAQRCLSVEKGRWHSLECLESGSVILECKDGKYELLREEEVLELYWLMV